MRAASMGLVLSRLLACEDPTPAALERVADEVEACDAAPMSCDGAFDVCLRRAERALRECYAGCAKSCADTCRVEGLQDIEICRGSHAQCRSAE